MLGPVLFGAALDAAGGASRTAAWVAGYAAIGSGCLLAPALSRWFAYRGTPSKKSTSPVARS
jgi:hypothetical protein